MQMTLVQIDASGAGIHLSILPDETSEHKADYVPYHDGGLRVKKNRWFKALSSITSGTCERGMSGRIQSKIQNH